MTRDKIAGFKDKCIYEKTKTDQEAKLATNPLHLLKIIVIMFAHMESSSCCHRLLTSPCSGNRRRGASLQRGRRPLAPGKQRDARDQRWRPPPRNERWALVRKWEIFPSLQALNHILSRQWPSPCNLQKTTRTPLPVFYSCHWFVASPRR